MNHEIIKIGVLVTGAVVVTAAFIRIAKVCYREGQRDGYSLGYDEGVEWGAKNAVILEDLDK